MFLNICEIISHRGFDLLKYLGPGPDIHISSFSPPAHQDLDHMKTNRTADIRIQEKNSQYSKPDSLALMSFSETDSGELGVRSYHHIITWTFS